jgi:hypothetical protein
MPAEENDKERGPDQLLVIIHLMRVVSAQVGGTNSCTPALSKELISTLSRRADSGPNFNNLFSTRQIRK